MPPAIRCARRNASGRLPCNVVAASRSRASPSDRPGALDVDAAHRLHGPRLFDEAPLRGAARQPRERAPDQRQARRAPRDDQHRACEGRRQRVDVHDIEAAEGDAVQQHGPDVAIELRPAYQRRDDARRVPAVLRDARRNHAVETRSRADGADQQHTRAPRERSNGPSSKPTTLVSRRAPFGPVRLTARAGFEVERRLGERLVREREVPPLLRVRRRSLLLHRHPQQQPVASRSTTRRRGRVRALVEAIERRPHVQAGVRRRGPSIRLQSTAPRPPSATAPPDINVRSTVLPRLCARARRDVAPLE